MEAILDLIGALLLVSGTLFLLLGGLGLVRMPDVYNRIQAGTKATTLGTLLSLGGIGFLHPEWSLKLLLIGIFLLFTNPLSSQIVARAAHRNGVSMASATKIDLLEENREKQP